MATVEFEYNTKNNVIVDLSEQQLVDCAGSYGNEGCNGMLTLFYGLVDFSPHFIFMCIC
jgi:hypothetical protein